MVHARIGAGSGTALRVLVADDSQELRQRVRPLLEHAGLAVVGEAADGAQAVAEATVHRPDVVLMDLRMPRMDGLQATRTLRQRLPGMPVVLWSGDGDAQFASAGRDSGARAVVPKGIPAAELAATLHAVCNGREETATVADGLERQPDPCPEAAAPPADAGAPLGSHPEDLPPGIGRTDPLAPQGFRPPEPSPEGLAASERVALEQLDAADGYTTRWMVGRAVTRSLVNRRLIVVASDYVLLTARGRHALADDQHRGRPVAANTDQADHGSQPDWP
ncbi:MAG TPA: response regulator transcription factor [Actinomycetes bacterium]|nr:response regulator transcription factor [Actinomycetes bacterium]